ncbi:related to Mig1 protein [Sporisorium scitamineum]|uniref:Related to Mig1 protein n=1 Tax=Sporisorium scitamineum TaxID=49012 RepID=A0A0F7RY02_9BASI|nr:related to Mig1 protein [Sporisorium scitamineum]CDS00228.1 hypothetical protein [Sporisorium scitamineum]
MLSKQRCGLAVALVFLLAFIQVALVAAADGDVICSTQPPILPRYDKYRQHCEKNGIAESHWPCFMYEAGDLYGTDLLPADATRSLDSDDSLLLVKDADLKDDDKSNPADTDTHRQYLYTCSKWIHISLKKK